MYKPKYSSCSGAEDAATSMEVDTVATEPSAAAGGVQAASAAKDSAAAGPLASDTHRGAAAQSLAGGVPLAASLTDAAMADAAVEDAEMVQYDEPEEDEQVPPPKEQQVSRPNTLHLQWIQTVVMH